MSKPPQILYQILAVLLASTDAAEDEIEIRGGGNHNELERKVSLEEAKAMALRGEVEGIFFRSGRFRHLRRLSNPVPICDPGKPPDVYISTSTAIARLNMGTYKQPLRQVETIDGKVIGEGDICGYVHAHCACRELDGAFEDRERLAA